MPKSLPLAALLPLLAGCVTPMAERLPVCDGQARRPANPYGSVLPSPEAPAPERPVDMRTDPAEPSDPPTTDTTGGCA